MDVMEVGSKMAITREGSGKVGIKRNWLTDVKIQLIHGISN